MKDKIKKINFKSFKLLLFVVAVLFLLPVEDAKADTFSVGDYIYNISLDRPFYNPGDNIVVSGSYNTLPCVNFSANLMATIDPIESNFGGFGRENLSYSIIPNGGSISLTAPSTFGIYYVVFKGTAYFHGSVWGVTYASMFFRVVDYSLSQPDNVTIIAGDNGLSAVSARVMNPANTLYAMQVENVTLSVVSISGPDPMVTGNTSSLTTLSGLGVSLSPVSGTPTVSVIAFRATTAEQLAANNPFTSAINVTSLATTQPGVYTVTIAGSPNPIAAGHNRFFTVTVTAPAANYSLSKPSNVTITAGGQPGSSSVNVNPAP